MDFDLYRIILRDLKETRFIFILSLDRHQNFEHGSSTKHQVPFYALSATTQ